jgi:hypothetical protein
VVATIVIKISNILEELVEELKSRFDRKISIISTMETGVSFACFSKSDVKFALIVAPMMGLEDENLVGLTVVKFGIARKDVSFRLADPNLLDKIENRVRSWLNHNCLATDWVPRSFNDSFFLDESD